MSGSIDGVAGGEGRRPAAPRSHETARPQLTARIAAAVRGSLTVLVAPAGWGKTTAVEQWARTRPGDVTWIDAVDDRDHDIVDAVADAIADVTEDHYVVVDRAHRLPPDTCEKLGDLIESAPPAAHFVLLTRADVLFPGVVARLRIRDEVAYLHTVDLSFDRDATHHLLGALVGHALAPAVVERVALQTAGWPAAIALIGVAMRETATPFDASELQFRAFVHDEILMELDESLRDFVLRTSVPDMVSPALCVSLTGRVDAEAALALLARYELFDDDPASLTYRRYRPMLRDALRSELRAHHSDAESRLLEVAAQWHIDQGGVDDIESAGEYLVRAGKWDAVCGHAERFVRLLHTQGRARVVVAWLDAVPRSLIDSDPRRVVLRAAALTLKGETLGAEATLGELGDTSTLPHGTRVAVATIRTVWGIGHLPPAQTLEATDTALELIDGEIGDDLFTVGGLLTPASARAIAMVMRARALSYLGRTSEALDVLDEAMVDGDALSLPRLHVHGTLAELHAAKGKLTEAERHVALAARIAHLALVPDHPFAVPAELAHVHVMIERGEYQRAARALERIDGLTRWGSFDVWLTHQAVARAWLAFAEGAPRRALDIIDAHRASADPVPALEARSRSIAVRCLLELGDPVAAGHRLAYEPDTPFVGIAGSAVQLALGQHDIRRAREILEAWPMHREAQDDLRYQLWSATVLQAEGRQSAALLAGEAVLEAATPEGHVRLFLDAGPHVRRLLVTLARRQPAGYAARLLTSPLPHDHTKERDSGTLSNRERLVLQHLANRLTYAEIAEAMFISRNTVKTHAKSVYTKLGVSGRGHAVERAQELGLL
ncbi:MAG TPA: LuxR C-terminal-related transcriptional regulator [Acidimicrobiia bacterium]